MTGSDINALLKSAALEATLAYCRQHSIPAPAVQDNAPPAYERELAAVRAAMTEQRR